MVDYKQLHRWKQFHSYCYHCVGWKMSLAEWWPFGSASKRVCFVQNITLERNLKLWRESPIHDDVIKWKRLPRYWPFVRGMNSPHKGQWRGSLMFTLICARINGWVNNREAGDLRRYRAHYDVFVMYRQASAADKMADILQTTLLVFLYANGFIFIQI